MAHRSSETEMGGPARGFPATHWSVVLRAQDPRSAERRRALEQLIAAYWKPVYHYLRRRGHDPETSKDLTQSFFTALLERSVLQDVVADDRARFRSYLLTVLRNFVADERDRAAAWKRGGGLVAVSLDFASAESGLPWTPTSDETPDAVFRKSWALRVLGQAWDSMRDYYASAGRLQEYELFRDHLSFKAEPLVSYGEMASRLGVTETDIKNRLHAARKRIAAAVRDVVRAYTDTEEDAQQEIRDLLSAFL